MTPPPQWPRRGDDDDTWRQLGDQFERWQSRSPRAPMIVAGLIILVIGLIWLATGVYTVRPGEQGVVRRFGKAGGHGGALACVIIGRLQLSGSTS